MAGQTPLQMVPEHKAREANQGGELMRIESIVAGIAMALLSSSTMSQTAPTPAAPEGPIHVVAYVEAAPASVSSTLSVLKAYAAETAKGAGSLHVGVFQEQRRPNRFVVEETWKDFAAHEGHLKALPLAARLSEGLIAPPDIRVHTEWAVAGSKGSMPAGAKYGFTHIDVGPPKLAELEAILKTYVDASRSDDGALTFDVVQAPLPRKNHLTLVEAWRDDAAFDKHQVSRHATEFRTRLGPLLGALYDQRFYERVTN